MAWRAGGRSVALEMFTLNLTTETAASPAQVLAIAGTDFSAKRAKIWPNVTAKRLDVHARGDDYAEVTEGATGIAWFAWERSRYEWSRPGTIRQTVLDSNVLEPGSSWALLVTPRNGGGSHVQMTLERTFRHSPAGRAGAVFNHLGGARGFGWMLRRALKAVERDAGLMPHGPGERNEGPRGNPSPGIR